MYVIKTPQVYHGQMYNPISSSFLHLSHQVTVGSFLSVRVLLISVVSLTCAILIYGSHQSTKSSFYFILDLMHILRVEQALLKEALLQNRVGYLQLTVHHRDYQEMKWLKEK